MKKFLTLLILTVLIAVTYPAKTLDKAAGDGKISFYSDKEFFVSGASTEKNGIGYVLTADIEDAEKIRRKLPEISGESIEIYGGSAKNILGYLNAEVVSREEIDGILFINAYSRYLKGYVKSNGRKINLQIAVYEDGKIIAGTPLILGSC
jgi:hypothetical protein